ncbi:gamma-glutamyl-gamma-aminobutyrate hydrolase family protein [Anaerovibrio sp. RM50]|uniref:gamma-glutamyl-gamma-aminobutyrate hydrolase family protein n=1 Tax=Anaerovibrio sp. RM50 TaxID=1200557 RepID=UPI0004862B05|nr:gamma-glutamyl-gamma-aminobutyrate hydrolase family protein [Anaerovibrio sp. RM50]
MRRIISATIVWAMMFLVLFLNITAEAAGNKPLVGVAWRGDTAESFEAACQAIEAAGGTTVVLDQVRSADLEYTADGKIIGCKDENGALTLEGGKLVRCNTWQNSNVQMAIGKIGAVVFPGGQDISPSLYYTPQPVLSKEGFNAERDVSDYLLMSYCLEKDIPILAICRGMQMLAVVSGADLIQDIPDYMASLGKSYKYEHRNEPKEQGAYRDFAFHDVTVTEKDSLLAQLTKRNLISNVPSWHHQAVNSIDGTRLQITGITRTNGTDIIEVVERPDKTFALGLQYHPEIAVVRHLDENSIAYFKAIVNLAKEHSSKAIR